MLKRKLITIRYENPDDASESLEILKNDDEITSGRYGKNGEVKTVILFDEYEDDTPIPQAIRSLERISGVDADEIEMAIRELMDITAS